MIERRAFLASGCAFAVLPLGGRADAVARLAIRGSLQQSGLVVGTAKDAAVTVDGQSSHVSPEGLFAFGLNYDQTKSSTVVAKFDDGKSETREIVPVVRKYDIQHVNGLPQKFVTPPAEVEERIKRENALVYEARKRDTAATDFAQAFDWPIKGIVSGTFGNQRIDNGTPMAPHFGVDIAAPKGTPIHAPVDGVVTLAEPDFYLTGGTTMLDHGHGVSTVYLHQDELKVKVGDAVKRGDVIGLVGMKGRATGPHLHWGMNWFQMRLDPSLSAATPAPEKG
ncbi:MAG TPA: M23 family metallopeptidase [Rhizomicrobium sp.]|nr:M23 family metallopeptidase [Rhizomicrobium sp.]